LLPNPKWFHYFLIQRARVSIMSRPSPSFGSTSEPNITHAADQQSWKWGWRSRLKISDRSWRKTGFIAAVWRYSNQ